MVSPDSRVPGVTASLKSGKKQESGKENKGFSRSHIYRRKELFELYLLKLRACEKTLPAPRTDAVNSDRWCSGAEMSKSRSKPGTTSGACC